MFKAINISKRFENTYNINYFLYKLSKIPILGNLISEDIYAYTPDKKIFSILITIYGFIRSLIIKLGYYFLLYLSILLIFKNNLANIFIHVLILFTILGIFINTSLFVPGKKNYYSINLLRMNANIYTFSNLYSNFILAFINNFLCLCLFHYILNIPIIYIWEVSLFCACSRILSEAFGLMYYKFKGNILINNSKDYFSLVIPLILVTYILPICKVVMNQKLILGLMILSLILMLVAINYLKSIQDYKIIYKRLNTKSTIGMDDSKINMTSLYEVDKKDYHIDENKLKGKKGYDYFNTIFFLRHKKILMTSAKNYSLIILALTILGGGYLLFNPEYKNIVYNFINNNFTWTLFIMYFLNRGALITQAMFYNCDRSMLKFNFYREEKVILSNFKTRVKTVVKVNLIPALTFALCLIAILLITAKSINPITYVTIFVSILVMSILFSIHYLVIYYLLQPYDENMSMKSFSYNVVSFITYYICYLCTTYTFSILRFTVFVIIISIIYLIVALITVKKKAPFTFRLK